MAASCRGIFTIKCALGFRGQNVAVTRRDDELLISLPLIFDADWVIDSLQSIKVDQFKIRKKFKLIERPKQQTEKQKA